MARSFTSSRAWKLHLSVLIWTPACIVAGWWQATRAMDGNALSYLYATEWPLLAGLGIWAWWMLLSTEPASPEQAAERQAFEQAERIKIAAARKQALDEDPNLAQYNEQLAQLAEEDRRNS
ncbi:MAG: hypothetical protein NT160_07445 [Actinobacteria bacterium]|nr:hypothetical protein [Actinomycetota bacterium]